MKPKSIKRLSAQALRQDEKARSAQQKTVRTTYSVKDSFENFQASLGLGTENLMSASSYGFNPISRNRTLLEWIHRGSWLGGVAIDIIPDDMTRAGVSILGDMDPEDEQRLQQEAVSTGVWSALNDSIKWARLYGGSIAVMMIEGQDMSTPFRLESVGKNQFKGLLIFDRWMVEPSLNDIVQEPGPNIGLPKYYFVNTTAPALVGKKIHYSRCTRFEGVRLPYWQRVTENLWGISVLERLYDRMVAFDSTSTGAAQLVFKSYLRTYKIKDLREIISAGGDALIGLLKTIQFMRVQQSIEGITLLDAEDEMETLTQPAFSGLADIMLQFGQQISGALQMPLVRLFGQSPAGLNSSGDSDLRTYYDGILQQQTRYMLEPVRTIYRAMAQSMGIKVDETFGVQFNPLWQLSAEEKATVAKTIGETVQSMNSAGLISDKTALLEIKASSQVTGVGTTITNEEIEAADDVPAPSAEALGPAGEGGGLPAGEENPDEPSQKSKDAAGEPKLSKAQVNYVEASTKPTHCSLCKYFRGPNACGIVAGEIAAAGGCDLFHARH